MQTTQPNRILWRIVPLLAVLVLWNGCRSPQPSTLQSPTASTTPPTMEAPIKYPLPVSRPFCTYCTISGSLRLHTDALTADGTFTIHLAGHDSLQGTIYGPLGILAARAYCTQDELLIFDALAMDAYRVRLPSTMPRATLPFPLQRKDVFALLRGELPYPDSTYLIVKEQTDRQSAIVAHRDTTFTDVAEITTDGLLRAYQRKTLDNQLLFAVEYRNWRTWDRWLYPSELRLTSPVQNVELIIMPETISELDTPFSFRFQLPKSVRPRTLE